MDNISAAAKVIKKALNKNKRVADGTIIKWDSRSDVNSRWEGRVFTYVGIKVGATWYISGEGRFWGKNVFAYDEFFSKVLSSAEVENIKVATAWEDIED